MCRVSNEILFCTCADDAALRRARCTWHFFRHVGDTGKYVLGRIVFDEKHWEAKPFEDENERTILDRLNSPGSFDVPLHPVPHDELHVCLFSGAKRQSFAYTFTSFRWVTGGTLQPFAIHWTHECQRSGKLRRVLRKK